MTLLNDGECGLCLAVGSAPCLTGVYGMAGVSDVGCRSGMRMRMRMRDVTRLASAGSRHGQAETPNTAMSRVITLSGRFPRAWRACHLSHVHTCRALSSLRVPLHLLLTRQMKCRLHLWKACQAQGWESGICSCLTFRIVIQLACQDVEPPGPSTMTLEQLGRLLVILSLDFEFSSNNKMDGEIYLHPSATSSLGIQYAWCSNRTNCHAICWLPCAVRGLCPSSCTFWFDPAPHISPIDTQCRSFHHQHFNNSHSFE